MIKLWLKYLIKGIFFSFLGIIIICKYSNGFWEIGAACLIYGLINMTISDWLLIEEGGNEKC